MWLAMTTSDASELLNTRFDIYYAPIIAPGPIMPHVCVRGEGGWVRMCLCLIIRSKERLLWYFCGRSEKKCSYMTWGMANEYIS